MIAARFADSRLDAPSIAATRETPHERFTAVGRATRINSASDRTLRGTGCNPDPENSLRQARPEPPRDAERGCSPYLEPLYRLNEAGDGAAMMAKFSGEPGLVNEADVSGLLIP